MKNIITLICFFLVIFTAVAQPPLDWHFEIRTSKVNSSRVAVDMRDTTSTPPKTTDFVLDIVFGIKWDNSADADLSSTIDQFGYDIAKSDVEKVKNGFEFQAFYANNVPYNFPNDWTQNGWETICEMDVTINNTAGAPWDFEICEVGFDPTTDLNINVNGMDYTQEINGLAMLVFKLLSFDAIRSGDTDAKLNWTAIVDENADYIDVERSTNGVVWSRIESQPVLIKNKTINSFFYTDKEVYSPEGDVQTFYYRLKMVNVDGSYTYSGIREVRFNDRYNNNSSYAHIYPNPANQVIQVSLPATFKDVDLLSLNLIQSNGHPVIHKEYNTDIPKEISLDVGLLSAGMYYLQIQSDKGEQQVPVVIQH